jgi:hypothetical protein
MRRLALLLALAAASACKSSGPYTLPAAAIETGMAVAFSAAQRSGGGCFATCTNGTSCNPNSGFCERISASAQCACQAGQICVEGSRGDARCVPEGTPTIFTQQDQASGRAIVIKPEPGMVPTLPPDKP